MLFIIDANNLSGKMELLDKKDFDKLMIGIIKDCGLKENAYVLVFDGVDSFGDKYTEENLTIVYAPRDEFCRSADDKIVEILENDFLKSDAGSAFAKAITDKYLSGFGQRKITVVTDDNLLKKRIEEIMIKTNCSIKTLSAAIFAEEIKRRLSKKESVEFGDEIDNKDDLSEDEIKEINNELMNIWK